VDLAISLGYPFNKGITVDPGQLLVGGRSGAHGQESLDHVRAVKHFIDGLQALGAFNVGKIGKMLFEEVVSNDGRAYTHITSTGEKLAPNESEYQVFKTLNYKQNNRGFCKLFSRHDTISYLKNMDYGSGQGAERLKGGAYKGVFEHFESLRNTAMGP
jgi:hypothetical protein